MADTKLTTLIGELLIPGRVTILGITGQAGAGKSALITPLALDTARDRGFHSYHLPLDYFFKLSSRERREWIAEGESISKEEEQKRKDQINWWDFELAERVLTSLKQGKEVTLQNVYNRSDGGELTGTVEIKPPPDGAFMVFEGVAIAHLNGLDNILYVHAPNRIRFARLLERDRHRANYEATKRFIITQEFELKYFYQNWHLLHYFLDNSNDCPDNVKDFAIAKSMRYEDAII